ncbi:hypothetical protein FEM48_Zijuj06G0188300 [Ziziphus jujuba var. spinosa]|uniref:Uncharacterized protein n=1 Tax=Ziziphus jujuba var. spinosa TaxID=714518 RepID=A0A978VB07_ZIZJJ|nr:hypothetical protein FEM48_Zijuj06G0188300 [Ziziphus jujuba var. spinosa]
MCLLKVANKRDLDDQFIRFQADQDQQHDEEETSELVYSQSHELINPTQSSSLAYHPQYVSLMPPPPPQPSTIFSGYSRPTEMSAMVSALTHVVSGQRGYGIGLSSSSSSSSSPSPSPSSGSSIGQKRGREDNIGAASSQLLLESSSRAYRVGLAPHDFGATQQGAESSPSATGQLLPPPAQTLQAVLPAAVSSTPASVITQVQPNPTPRPPPQPLQSVPFFNPQQFQSHPDVLRDYLQYSQLLQSSGGDFNGGQQQQQQQQPQPTSLLEQMFYNSQFGPVQSSFLSSSSTFSPSSVSSSSSSVSFPLLFSDQQQLGFFRPTRTQNPSGGSAFPAPSWSHSGHNPSSSG